MALFAAKVGAQVPPLDLVEMGLPEDLLTTVVAIEPCPPLQPGTGRVVLTTVNHLNNDVWELTTVNAAGRQEQLRPTGFHKFYSETRRDWISTKEIHDNEVIRGRAGPLTVVAKQPLPGTERVYNLTVEGEHVYYVSELGLLAHNNCEGLRRAKTIKFSQDDIDSTFSDGRKLTSTIAQLKSNPATAASIEPILLAKFKNLPTNIQDRLLAQGANDFDVFAVTGNRRLAAARLANSKINARFATAEELNSINLNRRFSTTSAGRGLPAVRQ